METKQTIGNRDARKTALNERLENIGWGLFLIVVGATWLEPGVDVPLGVWLITAGLIILGLNVVRYLAGIKTSSFTVGLGAVALAAGIASAVSVKIFGVLLILLGAGIILRPFFERTRLIHKSRFPNRSERPIERSEDLGSARRSEAGRGQRQRFA